MPANSTFDQGSHEVLVRQFETIFHSSSDGIWVCDGSGVVININRASETLNGIRAEDVIGHNIKDLLARKVFDHSVTSRVLTSGQRQTVMQFIPKTGKYLLSTGTPSLTEDGRIALIVINERDMTELNTLRREFEKSQQVREKYRQELSDISLLELERNDIVAESAAMRRILQMALKLSHIGASNILVLGESGTGKGLLARLIHKNSSRHTHPLVEINCAALPENLLEAELFGYEKGAFTGADEKGKIGLFELAQGGTLFLDEIGDMPLPLQAKLLKYLDNKEIRRVGGTRSIKVECATIAATNKDLKALVAARAFRQDLYYRLNSFILQLPPLRERREDIPLLIERVIPRMNRLKGKAVSGIDNEALALLMSHDYPGNIRELENIIEHAFVLCGDGTIGVRHLPAGIVTVANTRRGERLAVTGEVPSLEKAIRSTEAGIILEALQRNDYNRRATAEELGMHKTTLYRRLRILGIELPDRDGRSVHKHLDM